MCIGGRCRRSSMADYYLNWFLLLIAIPSLLFVFLTFITRPRPIKIPIKGRHVFITGGSTGIGLAVARLAAAQGARISILARSETKLAEAKQAIKDWTGTEAATFSADVRDFEAVQRAVDAAGPIDVLVVNQGVFRAEELDKLQVDHVKFMIDVNLMGSFNVVKAALPGMKRRVDRTPVSIALMSSLAGQVGIYGYTAYSATKFGLRGLAEALQQEVISDGIHISLICPPETDTDALTQEIMRRPELTRLIVGSAGSTMSVDEVARKTMNGIRNGSFVVPCNFKGFVVSLGTAGLSPQRSSLIAFMEIASVGILRIAALCTQWKWYGTIRNKWHHNAPN